VELSTAKMVGWLAAAPTVSKMASAPRPPGVAALVVSSPVDLLKHLLAPNEIRCSWCWAELVVIIEAEGRANRRS
jgi:hypothetical protein